MKSQMGIAMRTRRYAIGFRDREALRGSNLPRVMVDRRRLRTLWGGVVSRWIGDGIRAVGDLRPMARLSSSLPHLPFS